MAALRAIPSAPTPARREEFPVPYSADRASIGEAQLYLVEHPDQPSTGEEEQAPTFGQEPPPPSRHRGWRYDLIIRLAGLCGIMLAAGITVWLYRLIHAAPGQDGTLSQYAIGAIALLSASGGTGLLILGRHIHDSIRVSDRWQRRLSPNREFI
jgi:hypothetical protein